MPSSHHARYKMYWHSGAVFLLLLWGHSSAFAQNCPSADGSDCALLNTSTTAWSNTGFELVHGPALFPTNNRIATLKFFSQLNTQGEPDFAMRYILPGNAWNSFFIFKPSTGDIIFNGARASTYPGPMGDIIFHTTNPHNSYVSRVGIGTTSPTHELTVKGTIKSEEIIVETVGADFVFEDAYPLRPLEAVEAFIAQHGHLPDIASAQQMQEEGVELAAFTTLLLQKIEELTLYTIEQQKQIEALQRERSPVCPLDQ